VPWPIGQQVDAVRDAKLRLDPSAVYGCMYLVHFIKKEEAMSPRWPLLKMKVPSSVEAGKKLEKLSQLFGFNEKTKRGNSIT